MLDMKPEIWSYRTLPSKLLELVKNVGGMEQEGTGYFVDNEAEMLIILAYLNYGETTNITDSMKEQIDQAVEHAEAKRLLSRDE